MTQKSPRQVCVSLAVIKKLDYGKLKVEDNDTIQRGST